MIPEFKGHHFVEDTQLNQPPSLHHCERCGMKAVLEPAGSTKFDDGSGAPIRIGAQVLLDTSPVPRCKPHSG
jgi:hypothetical protein